MLASFSVLFILGMEDECIQELQRVLPELDSLEFTALVQHLTTELGLTKKEDLSLVEADDLQHHLKPILRRRFLQAFKPKGEKKNSWPSKHDSHKYN